MRPPVLVGRIDGDLCKSRIVGNSELIVEPRGQVRISRVTGEVPVLDSGNRFDRVLRLRQADEKIDLPGCRNEVTRSRVTSFGDPVVRQNSGRL
jgi:hypothetical protein